MKTLQILISTLLLIAINQKASATCILGEKEDHLTIERVMRNFGRFTMPADMITLRSLNPSEAISDDQLKTAVEKLGWAIDCAQAVLDNPNEHVIPTEAKMKPGPEREEHINDYLYFMTDFRDGLNEYRLMFKNLLELKSEERDYKPVRKKCIELDKLIDHAHKKV